MKNLFMSVLVASTLLITYGCNTKTTTTNEKNTEIQNVDNEAAAESNAKSGYGGDPSNRGGVQATQPADSAGLGAEDRPQ